MTVLSPMRPWRTRGGPAPEAIRPPTGGRDRRALVAVASLVVICASVATFASLYSSAGRKTSVIVVQQALVQGQPITAAQLGRAEISVSSDVAVVPVTEVAVVLGKRAATAVPAGSLLTLGDLTSAPTLVAGSAVVGLALKDGQYPKSGLDPGELVMVVQTATPGSPLSAPVNGSPTGSSGTGSSGTGTSGTGTSSSGTVNASSGAISGIGATVLAGSGTGVLVAKARVFAISPPSANASGGFALLVSIEVTSAIAPDVATAASAGQVSLVLLAQGAAATPLVGAPA
jgi:hypothetical protein